MYLSFSKTVKKEFFERKNFKSLKKLFFNVYNQPYIVLEQIQLKFQKKPMTSFVRKSRMFHYLIIKNQKTKDVTI